MSNYYEFIELIELVLDSELDNLKRHGIIDLTFNELHILLKINNTIERDQIPTPNNLQDELKLTKSTLSTITNKLIKKKYLIKEKSIYDNRRIYFILKEKARYAIDIHNSWMKEVFSGEVENLDEKEKKNFFIILKLLKYNLENQYL